MPLYCHQAYSLIQLRWLRSPCRGEIRDSHPCLQRRNNANSKTRAINSIEAVKWIVKWEVIQLSVEESLLATSNPLMRDDIARSGQYKQCSIYLALCCKIMYMLNWICQSCIVILVGKKKKLLAFYSERLDRWILFLQGFLGKTMHSLIPWSMCTVRSGKSRHPEGKCYIHVSLSGESMIEREITPDKQKSVSCSFIGFMCRI